MPTGRTTDDPELFLSIVSRYGRQKGYPAMAWLTGGKGWKATFTALAYAPPLHTEGGARFSGIKWPEQLAARTPVPPVVEPTPEALDRHLAAPA